MKRSNRFLQLALGGALIIGSGIYYVSGPGPRAGENIKVPPLTPLAASGKIAYDNNCASCHGINGAGTKQGPPFIHNVYNPGHHGDESFFRAVRNGVPQHHWPYGNMPPRPDVTDGQISAIVKYIRELQKANGIVYKKHMM